VPGLYDATTGGCTPLDFPLPQAPPASNSGPPDSGGAPADLSGGTGANATNITLPIAPGVVSGDGASAPLTPEQKLEIGLGVLAGLLLLLGLCCCCLVWFFFVPAARRKVKERKAAQAARTLAAARKGSSARGLPTDKIVVGATPEAVRLKLAAGGYKRMSLMPTPSGATPPTSAAKTLRPPPQLALLAAAAAANPLHGDAKAQPLDGLTTNPLLVRPTGRGGRGVSVGRNPGSSRVLPTAAGAMYAGQGGGLPLKGDAALALMPSLAAEEALASAEASEGDTGHGAFFAQGNPLRGGGAGGAGMPPGLNGAAPGAAGSDVQRSAAAGGRHGSAYASDGATPAQRTAAAAEAAAKRASLLASFTGAAVVNGARPSLRAAERAASLGALRIPGQAGPSAEGEDAARQPAVGGSVVVPVALGVPPSPSSLLTPNSGGGKAGFFRSSRSVLAKSGSARAVATAPAPSLRSASGRGQSRCLANQASASALLLPQPPAGAGARAVALQPLPGAAGRAPPEEGSRGPANADSDGSGASLTGGAGAALLRRLNGVFARAPSKRTLPTIDAPEAQAASAPDARSASPRAAWPAAAAAAEEGWGDDAEDDYQDADEPVADAADDDWCDEDEPVAAPRKAVYKGVSVQPASRTQLKKGHSTRGAAATPAPRRRLQVGEGQLEEEDVKQEVVQLRRVATVKGDEAFTRLRAATSRQVMSQAPSPRAAGGVLEGAPTVPLSARGASVQAADRWFGDDDDDDAGASASASDAAATAAGGGGCSSPRSPAGAGADGVAAGGDGAGARHGGGDVDADADALPRLGISTLPGDRASHRQPALGEVPIAGGNGSVVSAFPTVYSFTAVVGRLKRKVTVNREKHAAAAAAAAAAGGGGGGDGSALAAATSLPATGSLSPRSGGSALGAAIGAASQPAPGSVSRSRTFGHLPGPSLTSAPVTTSVASSVATAAPTGDTGSGAAPRSPRSAAYAAAVAAATAGLPKIPSAEGAAGASAGLSGSDAPPAWSDAAPGSAALTSGTSLATPDPAAAAAHAAEETQARRSRRLPPPLIAVAED
jgi:hypothetical protein